MTDRIGLSPEIVQKVRAVTCAIGKLECPLKEYLEDPFKPRFQILGTGFLARADTVITARHVITRTLQAIHATSPKFPPVAVFFVPDGMKVRLLIYEWEVHGWLEPPLSDLGTLRITENDSSIRAVLRPVVVAPLFDAQVGTPVAVLGFAFGTGALVDQNSPDGARLYRTGPILQQGYISSIAPFDQAARVDRILLDLRTTAGMSGGALINSVTGKVIGVHTGGYEKDPSVVAFATPLTESIADAVMRWLDVPRPPGVNQASLRIGIPAVRRSDPQ